MISRTNTFLLGCTLGITLLLTHCGGNECGGTETGNPSCSSTSNTSGDSTDGGVDGNIQNTDSFTTLELSTAGPIDYPASQLVIDNATDFTTLWEALHGDVVELPTVDFDTEWVVAVVMGQSNTGGYTIEVTSVTTATDQITVNVTATVPGSGCMVTDALTNPFHIISITRPESDTTEVEFVVTEEITEC